MGGRRKSGLLLITSTVLTVRTVIALASGNTFLYFLQPVATDACVATAFFVSLMTARPAIARLAADFYPMTDEVAQRPRIQQLFRQLTLLWACTCAVKAGVTFWLLNTMSVEAFVVLKSGFVLSMNGLTIATTIMAALVVAKAEGLVGHTATPLPQPLPDASATRRPGRSAAGTPTPSGGSVAPMRTGAASRPAPRRARRPGRGRRRCGRPRWSARSWP